MDSGNGRKLERFGKVVVDRPAAQAVWSPRRRPDEWQQADALFTRERGNRWEFRNPLPRLWEVRIDGLTFGLRATDFGHVGVFPEHRSAWQWVTERVSEPRREGRQMSALNLFAYSGGATLALARAGATVCHLDAARKMNDWARANAESNGLADAPVRWIADDAVKFLKREARRGRVYDGIILDPPSFGRGTKQELFKIEDTIVDLLAACSEVLSRQPAFVFLSCHTPGFTPLVLHHLLRGMMGSGGQIDTGEMTLTGGPEALPLPSGAFAGWRSA